MSISTYRILDLAEKALTIRLTRDELLQLIPLPDQALTGLWAGAERIRTHFFGTSIHLCTICNAKSGRCSEDCHYCAQSAHFDTHVAAYPLLPHDQLVQDGMLAAHSPIHRYAMVTSGRRLPKQEIPQVAKAMGDLQEANVNLCASLGILDKEDLLTLKAHGMTRYHHNLETCRELFPRICTTHGFEERVATLRMAKEIGLQVCSGGIFGMGENLEQTLDLALTLRDIDVDAVPMNFLIPIPGTPLENTRPLQPLECLRRIALFRFALPDKEIIICGGRVANLKELHPMVFQAGASGIMTGNYLTRQGRTLQQDLDLLEHLGLEPRKPSGH
ncbi:biotin synthase BioB [Desulfoplanes formicivorans]|uniref:Biotin synthase n=1 Tax=Desulfoplanes formicivorans TaxID=1592317 RepID=A0A194AIU9_9BACT|nr:biotin synthase BioB [Desulfoplanes formicivorans]GAU08996.1 biotin synthase [Desulfoplanes formicivorans]